MEGHPTKGILDDQERFDIIDDVFDILRVPGQEDGKALLDTFIPYFNISVR